MKLSIITCTYNSEKYLQECIDSVISQNLDKDIYEHIFIDWYSKDWTENIINSYIKNYPNSNIRLIKSEPKWVYNAFNKWVFESKWDYLIFLNSDDKVINLKKYINFIVTQNSDFYFWNTEIINSKSEYVRTVKIDFKELSLSYMKKQNICHQAIIFSKNIFDTYWLFDESYKIVSDYKYLIKLVKNWVIWKYFNEKVIQFREHEDWLSSWIQFQNISSNELIKLNYLEFWILAWLKIILLTYVFRFIKIIFIKLNIYNYLSPIWRKYVLNNKYWE